MEVQQQIESILTQALSPELLDVVNESHQHSVPANSETHFRVAIVAAAFDGKRKVARHQTVYGLLGALLEGPVHALALHTYTPQEWQEKQQIPESPECLGGSKAEAQ